MGGILSIDAIAMIILSNVHTGHFVTLGAGAIFCAFAFIYNKIAFGIKIAFFSLYGLSISIECVYSDIY